MMGGFAKALALAGDLLHTILEPPGSGIATWFLAGTFAISGIAKVRQPALTAMAMVDFGVARRVRPRWGQALGAAEVALAGALVLLPRLAILVAMVLLWFFVSLIARSLWDGRRFACFCFGDAEAPLSRWTLVRTTALALLATALALSTAHLGLPSSVQAAGLEVIAAVALLGGVALVNHIRSLLSWNREPWRIRTEVRL
jgi:hypothetical protein